MNEPSLTALSLNGNALRVPVIIGVFLLFSVFMCSNCYMTDNPYLARHSSAAGALGAESWRVAPAYGLFAFVTIYVLLSLGSLPMNTPVLILAGAIALSGVVNGHLWLSPRTYLYDCVMLILVAAIAYNDAKTSIGEEWTIPFLWYVYVLIAIGLLLSIFFPDTFGHIGNFSRERRGEVTLLAALGLLPMLGPLGFHQLATGQGPLYRTQAFMLAAVPLCLALLSATRGGVAAWGVLAIAYALLYSRHFGRILLVAVCFLTVAVGVDAFIEYFTLGYSWHDLRILNGRGELWEAHIMAFLKTPIFGSGAGLSNRLEYDSLASSEIGVLRWFSEYGLICGLGIVFVLWKGAPRCLHHGSISCSGTYDIANA